MKRLAIIGAGDLGHQIAHHARGCGYDIIGFFDDYHENVIGKTSSIQSKFEEGIFDELMIGIGYKHMEARSSFFDDFYGRIPFAKIVHASTIIDPSSSIGEGSFIYPGCVIDLNVKIGNNVSLNAGCIIAHDSSLGSHSMLSPGVVISGFVTIAENVNLGTGTKVIDNIKISKGIRTGAGAVVTKNLIEEGLYVGVPALYKKAK